MKRLTGKRDAGSQEPEWLGSWSEPGDAPSLPSLAGPAVIDLGALDGSNGFRIDGINSQDYSGWSVASAGDVNGDGFDDVIVGAYSGGVNDRGQSYVVFGSDATFAASLDLASLDGSNGFRLDGDLLFGYSGWSVASAGDVNGDGFDDVVIGAPEATPPFPLDDENAGVSYVVFGSDAGFAAAIDLGDLDGINGFRLDGVDEDDASGNSVASAGDVNGDGFDDVVIGANERYPGGDRSGESYVVFGKAGGFAASLDLATLDGANGFRIDGIDAADESGVSVASAGDFNGDGFGDIIIGARFADPDGASAAGESYVVFGKASGFSASLSLAALNGANGFRIDGIDAADNSGISVASAGDVNGDGIGDVIIGARFADPDAASAAGESYVVFGKASGFGASFDLASLNGSNGFRIDGIDANDESGFSVASAGDFNGDGFDDLVVGAHLADPGGASAAGESYVVFGKAGGFAASIDLAALDGSSGFRLDGIDPNDRSGRSVASAGDVNGDGFDDLVIGAPYGDAGGSDAGESYVIFGFATDSGGETIVGTNGADSLVGGTGDDSLRGRDGNDTLQGNDGSDTLNGSDGSDWADYRAGAKVRADLDQPGTNTGDADGDVYISIENLRGSNGKDKLFGDGLANRIEGRGNNDVLNGRGGKDSLAGGTGKDTLTGGSAKDRFELASDNPADADVITDFSGDVIGLDSGVFGLSQGALAANRFVIGNAAGDANDRVIYNDASGKLFFDPDGTGAQAQVLIATLTGQPTLGAGDFTVI